MDAESRYLMLYAMGAADFDVAKSEAAFERMVALRPVAALETARGERFWLRRDLEAGSVKPKLYRVFETYEQAATTGSALATFRLRGPCEGRATVSSAAVDERYRRRGIARSAYNEIDKDVSSVRAELWPSSPAALSDDAFLFWWRHRPDLVLYYPARERLKMPLTLEQHAALGKIDSLDRQLQRLRRARTGGRVVSMLAAAAEVWLRSRFVRK